MSASLIRRCARVLRARVLILRRARHKKRGVTKKLISRRIDWAGGSELF